MIMSMFGPSIVVTIGLFIASSMQEEKFSIESALLAIFAGCFTFICLNPEEMWHLMKVVFNVFFEDSKDTNNEFIKGIGGGL